MSYIEDDAVHTKDGRSHIEVATSYIEDETAQKQVALVHIEVATAHIAFPHHS